MVVLRDVQQKTIEQLNPWVVGRELELGIVRQDYLAKIDELVKQGRRFVFILGSRRLGKTTIILQYIHQLIGVGVDSKKILFLSLDNTNLVDLDVYSLLTEGRYEYVFLDEVHYLKNWARILKSLYDLPGYKTRIVATGSSSKAIEDNEAYLTGRKTKIFVSPLSYREFEGFVGASKQLNEYLYYGGYPEHVLERNPNYLNELLRDVLEKDILKVHRMRNGQNLIEVAQMIAKQVGHTGSANKMAKVLGLDNKTVSNFVEYLREVQLIVPVYQYDVKLNARLYSPKKYYFADLGMRNSLVGFVDMGAIVENAVFLKLRELYGEENIFYGVTARGEEIDFVVKTRRGVVLVESKYINLRESVENKLAGIFWSNEWDEAIIGRIVVTDEVGGELVRGGVKARLVGLQEFLATPTLKEG